MMIRVCCAAVILACGLAAVPASAQSLADVARQEAARRKTAKKAVKSFSNGDLAAADTALSATAVAPAAQTGCIESASQGKCVSPDDVIATSQAVATQEDPQVKTSEATIRAEASRIRETLQKAREEFDTISSTADDPSRSAGERAAAARMAAQRETMLAGIESRWRSLERQVADEGLPREWLGVPPTLSPRIPQ